MAAGLDDVAWPRHTERLTLRRVVASDFDATWRYRRLASVSRWMSSASTDPEAYRATFVDPERSAKTLVIELGGLVVGDLMLAIGDAWAQTEVADQAHGVQAELGWCLDPDYAGHGYASEAVLALIELCFETLGIRRITASCFADNEPSWRLMERVGMRREARTVQDSLHRTDGWIDGLDYALLATEWRARRSRQPKRPFT